jgi:hypothetical protein
MSVHSPTRPSAYTVAFMRRRLLERRAAMFEYWRRVFPRHDFGTLRLTPEPIKRWPNEEAWAESARAYHQERKRHGRR